MMTFRIITLFPESFESYLNASIIKRAQVEGYISIEYYNPRDFAVSDKGDKNGGLTYAERRVDDRPYGGGPGMVIEALPVARAVEKAVKDAGKKRGRNKPKVKIVFFSPSGEQFTNRAADSFKKYTDIVLVCGRYEGIDARVKKMFKMADVSIGPYVLTGGELPAMVLIDAITRRVDGVLGDSLSIEEERVASPDVYTRPEIVEFKGKNYKVPKILLSGHHSRINKWKSDRR